MGDPQDLYYAMGLSLWAVSSITFVGFEASKIRIGINRKH